MKDSNVISIFRRRPPAWQALPDKAAIDEPTIALADQLHGRHTQAPPGAAPAADVLTRPHHAPGSVRRRPGAAGHRLRLARELLGSASQSLTGNSHDDQPGGTDVQP